MVHDLTDHGASILRSEGSDGRLRVSARHLDEQLSAVDVPAHGFARAEFLSPGEIDPLPIGPSFGAGEQRRFVVSSATSWAPRCGVHGPSRREDVPLAGHPEHYSPEYGGPVSGPRQELRRVQDGDGPGAAQARLALTATTPREQLRAAILALAIGRGADRSTCPSDAARAVADEWRPLVPQARELARELARAGAVRITQGSRVLDPDEDWHGPIRIRANP